MVFESASGDARSQGVAPDRASPDAHDGPVNGSDAAHEHPPTLKRELRCDARFIRR
jgi:hypothetical protein